MSDVEVKRVPKFKRCKITQQQLSALMTNFGATPARTQLMSRVHTKDKLHTHARGPPDCAQMRTPYRASRSARPSPPS